MNIEKVIYRSSMNTAASPDRLGGTEVIGENISLDQIVDSLTRGLLNIESMLDELEILERKIHSEPVPKEENIASAPSDTVLGKLRQFHFRLDRVAGALSQRVIFMRRITATPRD